jgi:dienelactone hydrolase
VAAGQTAPPVGGANKDASRLFGHDSPPSFELEEGSSEERDGIRIRDISFASHNERRGRVKVYLVTPPGKGPFAGVLFFHWLGEVNGNRKEFVEEAVTLAREGTVSLLIQGSFPWAMPPKDGSIDRQRIIDETIDLGRAVDLLLSQPNVDSSRVGYVGHDYGAMYGALLAAADKRIKTYILMAPIARFSYWSLGYWLAKLPDQEKEAYRSATDDVEPIHYLGQRSSANLLLQFARSDEHITKEQAAEFADATSVPKEVRWYESKHNLDVEAARLDRHEFLARELDLSMGKPAK